ncbi:MAG: efflux RND transporter permease subunit [Rhodospirillaceae bacterium]|nr:efflux RND transporter permease subunit [Rhodospirillaceae bacterium]
MMLSDFSIKRPVVAIVASLLLLVFGFFSMLQLPIRETPNVEVPVVSVSVAYRGASAEIVETKVIQVLEDQISGIEGIKSVASSARNGSGNVTIEFFLGRDIDGAANDVREQVSRAAYRLPQDADPPVIQKADSDSSPTMILTVSSPSRDALALSDYVDRYVRDRITAVDGVAFAIIFGYRKPSLRIWLDRRALAARDLTVVDIENALRRENVELGAGSLESQQRDFTIRTARNYQTPEDFSQLVISRGANNYLVRLGEVAKVEVAAEDFNSVFKIDGKPAVGFGVVKRPGASSLAMAQGVIAEVASLNKSLPPDMRMDIQYNASEYISESMREVGIAMGVAALLVVVIIYLFLGTVSAAIIPTVTVPVSLIGTFIVLWAMGFSINIFTFLALVLAIGLVVDDAIIMLENIHRRMKRGEPPLLAAYRGARQVGMAVVATTLVLAAVFVPVMFMSGTVGSLFNEFAVAMAASVMFSMFIALTLTPVMCSKILRDDLDNSPMARKAQHVFEILKAFYRKTLIIGLDHPKAVMGLFFGIVAAAAGLFALVPQEFSPVEDRGVIMFVVRAPQGSSVEYTDRQASMAADALSVYVADGEAKDVMQMVPFGGGAGNSGNIIMHLSPWKDRDRASKTMIAEVRAKLKHIPGAQITPILPPAIGQNPFSGGLQFAIGGNSYEELRLWRDRMFTAMRENPRLVGVRSDYNETTPQMRIHIDRDRAADLGVSSNTIGQTLQVLLGSRKSTTYLDRGREYDVIMQSLADDRQTPADVSNIYVRSDTTKELIPLSSLITLEELADTDTLSRYNRLRSITITANPLPGYSMGQAVADIEQMARDHLPPEARTNWRGEALELKESGVLIYVSFGLALIVVFLVLAAQFESFVHPFIIMMTVPLGVGGALAGLFVFGQSLNIYSQIGIIVLIGLAAKNGILIVEFTNQLRDSGVAFREALVEAATIRLRPIIMTALATVMGALPLVFSAGAGYEGRRAIGVVIVSGVSFASFVTLLVVPVMYMILARGTGSPGRIAAELKDYEAKHPTGGTKGAPAEQPAE